MSLVRVLLQRVALGGFAAWTLLTSIFAVFTLTEDWVLGKRLAMTFYGQRNVDPEEVEQLRQEYLSARGLDRPILEQYTDWMGNMATLRWGQSFETGEAVRPAVRDAVIATGGYVLPAIAMALVLGLGIGVVTALRRGSRSAEFLRGGSYLGLGLPHFWVGIVVLAVANVPPAFYRLNDTLRPADMPFVYGSVLPALLVGAALAAAIVSYSRAYCLEYLSTDAIKLVRANGGGSLAVTRHVVRNAAIPLVSIAFTETFALLALSVFVVEAVFGIDGIGLLIYNAVWSRDLPMLLGATLVVVSVGVASSVLQDVAYSSLDPRVDAGTR